MADSNDHGADFLPRLLGQPTASRLLGSAIRNDRLYPSYLFVGPPGTGKRTAALEIAKALACRVWGEPGAAPTSPPAPCGKCRDCGRVDRGSHPDVQVVAAPEGKRFIPVELIREADEFLRLQPLESRRRVIVVDGADRMLEPSQNALLKTLEEPPRSAHVLLVASGQGKLLPTVLSRCPRVPFGRLTPEHLEALLRADGADPQEARSRALAARGSAAAAFDGALPARVAAGRLTVEAMCGRAVADALAAGGPASPDPAPDDPFSAAEAVVAAALEASATAGDTLESRRQAVLDVLDEAAELIRRGLGVVHGVAVEGGPTVESLAAAGAEADELLQQLRALDEAMDRIARNVTLDRVLAGLFLASMRAEAPRSPRAAGVAR